MGKLTFKTVTAIALASLYCDIAHANVCEPSAQMYKVVGVESHDTLNVRFGPSIKYQVVDELRPDETGISLTGRYHANTEFCKSICSSNAPERTDLIKECLSIGNIWYEIRISETELGWTSARHLTIESSNEITIQSSPVHGEACTPARSPHRITGIADGYSMNVRDKPSKDALVIGQIAFDEKNVNLTGQYVAVDQECQTICASSVHTRVSGEVASCIQSEKVWFEVKINESHTGWGLANFFTPEAELAPQEYNTNNIPTASYEFRCGDLYSITEVFNVGLENLSIEYCIGYVNEISKRHTGAPLQKTYIDSQLIASKEFDGICFPNSPDFRAGETEAAIDYDAYASRRAGYKLETTNAHCVALLDRTQAIATGVFSRD